MMLPVKLWLARKIRRVAGIDELDTRLACCEGLLRSADTRQAEHLHNAETRLNDRLTETARQVEELHNTEARLNERLTETVCHLSTEMDGIGKRLSSQLDELLER